MAIRGLRLALGRSPEAMAAILGCSSAGYQKWEGGRAQPSAEWLLRLLQLCPDEQTRNAFRIRSERRSRPRDEATRGPRPGDDVASAGPRACRDAARSAIDTLCACAEAGDEKAGERLRQFSRSLHGAAEHFRQKPAR